MPRSWGYWTRGKLDVLRRHLDAFTTASKGVSERIYLDLFAGEPSNTERFTDEPIEGSARIALATDDPPFTRLRFFELSPRAGRLQAQIDAEFLGRDARVIPGDCNDTIHDALRTLRPLNWAPTFAFVDPNGPNFRWSTLEALAAFKRPGYSKVELWILFPPVWRRACSPWTGVSERAMRLCSPPCTERKAGGRSTAAGWNVCSLLRRRARNTSTS
jgi:three-Cys-motif partner protein